MKPLLIASLVVNLLLLILSGSLAYSKHRLQFALALETKAHDELRATMEQAAAEEADSSPVRLKLLYQKMQVNPSTGRTFFVSAAIENDSGKDLKNAVAGFNIFDRQHRQVTYIEAFTVNLKKGATWQFRTEDVDWGYTAELAKAEGNP